MDNEEIGSETITITKADLYKAIEASLPSGMQSGHGRTRIAEEIGHQSYMRLAGLNRASRYDLEEGLAADFRKQLGIANG